MSTGTEESAAAGMIAKDDAPVRIGFVQVSPDQRWRVSLLRTPAAGEVLDAAKLTINVETLASPDATKKIVDLIDQIQRN